MKKIMLTVVLTALVFLDASPAFAQSVIDVNLGTLLSEIENNSARAKQNYGGKTIRTRGRIQYIYDGYVSIGNDILPVLLVYLPNSEIAKLQKGQTITVRGVFALLGTGLIGGLQRAVIEANPPQATAPQSTPAPQPSPAPAATPAPQQSQPQNANIAETYYKSARAAYDSKDYNKAIADCTQAIQLNQNYYDAYFMRALAYSGKGDYDSTIADYTQALRLNPASNVVYWNRSIAYSNKGDYNNAIADATRAIQSGLTYANIYIIRANAYLKKGDYRLARADVNTALKADRNYQEAKNLDAELKKKGY